MSNYTKADLVEPASYAALSKYKGLEEAENALKTSGFNKEGKIWRNGNKFAQPCQTSEGRPTKDSLRKRSEFLADHPDNEHTDKGSVRYTAQALIDGFKLLVWERAPSYYHIAYWQLPLKDIPFKGYGERCK